ncbi:9806_t:CDS:10 [Gigaspora margarita]|uniref:9806_t:CDS:1 n=1 Tax=Gigaspora margarita TaxID=4874 RepID=A0ABN7UY19_GIGMA|nr:9806_t:CDS:10 [Gigaspora margarita]
MHNQGQILFAKSISLSSRAFRDLPNIPLFTQIFRHAETQPKQKPAIIDVKAGTSHSYCHLVSDIIELRKRLLKNAGTSIKDLKEEKVAFLCPNGYDYVVSQWSVWSAGGIAVPLCITHPPSELLYVLKDSQSSIIITHSDFQEKINDIAHEAGIKKVIVVSDKDQKYSQYDGTNFNVGFVFDPPTLIPTDISRRAMIIYTSGTTGKPKGVVTTHASITAQVKSLVDAWRWNDKDKILHVLPLHHLHGIVNALTCGLYAGATVEMMPKFDAAAVWNRWMKPDNDLSLFMAVPTIYSKLIKHYKENIPKEIQPLATQSCSQFRLMVSGSSSLPTPIRNSWKEISGGVVLLERYGMSEIGMALSHEYEIEKRYEGCVGVPLPGVQVRLISEDGKDVTNLVEQPGELNVKGPNVFKEYLNRPEATKKEFTEDGWFKTGDVAMITAKEKVFKILGRKSVDIIKSGSYKLSALEIEKELLSHPDIQEISIVGIEDQEWGQKVGAIVVLKNQESKLDLKQLREFGKDKLAHYKLPTLLKVINELPKNSMGKANKKELVKLFVD